MRFLIKQICINAIIIFLLVNFTYATTVVVIRVDNKIYIGSDRKILNADYKTNRINTSKIRQVNNVFISASGLVVDWQYNFDIFEIAKSCFNNPNNVMNEFSVFIDSVRTNYSAYIEEIKTNRQNIFRLITTRKIQLEIVIVAQIDGIPLFIVSAFEPQIIGDDITIIYNSYFCPGDCLNNSAITVLGYSSEVWNLCDMKPDFWKINPIEFIRESIHLESIKHPDFVSSDIDIIEIGSDYFSWIKE